MAAAPAIIWRDPTGVTVAAVAALGLHVVEFVNFKKVLNPVVLDAVNAPVEVKAPPKVTPKASPSMVTPSLVLTPINCLSNPVVVSPYRLFPLSIVAKLLCRVEMANTLDAIKARVSKTPKNLLGIFMLHPQMDIPA
jgi:hypothetical protein